MSENRDRNSVSSLSIAGGLILPRLKVLGIEHVYVNSGTDFPPIIEGLAEATFKGIPFSEPILVPHEHVAMGMAYGNYKVSRSPQAVILHTNVGLANATTGIINAACENVPIIVMSGRTPVTEAGRLGSRTVPIGWGQEMFDQASLIREACKWEYEVRFPEQLIELLDRAYAMANSTPKGPVYISLPREVISMKVDNHKLFSKPGFDTFKSSPDVDKIELLCDWLEQSSSPLLITQRDCDDESSFRKLNALIDKYGMAACTWWATGLTVSTENPCHIGSDPQPYLQNADLILVLNSPAPWQPSIHEISNKARIVNLGPDPLFSRFPIRNFGSDLTISGEVSAIITELSTQLKKRNKIPADKIQKRKNTFTGQDKKRFDRANVIEKSIKSGVITKQAVSSTLGQILHDLDSTVFSELGADLDLLGRTNHGSWFQEPYSGGLGWSFPSALGAKIANPEKLIIAIMGDGSYLFANPTVCHQVAEALRLPILVVVLNNREWGAVKHSVLNMFPDGFASRMNNVPLTSLEPSPDFCKVASASNAWSQRVDVFSELKDVLLKGIEVTINEQRAALIEVIVESAQLG